MSEEVKAIKSGTTSTPEKSTAEQAVLGLVDTITSAVKEKSKRPMSHKMKKHVGQNVGMVDKNAVSFLSLRKSLTLFVDDQQLIIFKARNFVTDDQKLITFIRNHPSFGSEIYEGKYPEHVVKAMTENDKYITHDRKEYDSGSYT